MKRFIAGAMAGAVAMYLLDPDRGRGRRARVRQQWSSRVRSVDRAADRFERDAANRAEGARARADGKGIFHPSDDRALEVHLHQVLAEIDVATSVDGVVRVRGQVASEADIARVVRAINGVPGVQGVESLMHLPGEPAPNKKPARAAGV